MAIEDTSVSSGGAETVLWKGHSSQWVHFWYYLFCVVLAVGIVVAGVFTAGAALVGLVVPVGMWGVRWWMTKTTEYELTTQRFKTRSGILNRKLDELELFRVRDYGMDQPLMLRIFGLGNITMMTSDASSPTVALRAIADVESVREKLRSAVQTERDRRRVRALDMVDGEGRDHDHGALD
jgi:uncharacterized membrane protein YdbT with pleckstrin-like domain